MDVVRFASKMLAATLLLSAGIEPATAQVPQWPAAATVRSAWYLPELAENNDPICPEVLNTTRELFATRANLIWGDGRGEPPPAKFGPLELVPSDALPVADQKRYIDIGKERIYLLGRTYPGCGGACESYGLQVVREGDNPATADTPAAREWPLYRDTNARLFTVASDGELLHVYRITRPEDFTASCKVNIVPPVLASSTDPDVVTALASLYALEQAATVVAGVPGSCGSMATADRLRDHLHKALEHVLVRPWADWSPGDSVSTDWQFQGLFEQKASAALDQQYARTTQDIAAFFMRKNGWPPAEAFQAADGALRAALQQGFLFGVPEDEPNALAVATRVAILRHRPIAEIRVIASSVDDFDTGTEDAIVNVAMEYPEALEDLLARGANPNQANAFGKTPLMYAAQYNAVEAAKILLRHGADPNASTVDPGGDCNYQLHHFLGTTALHYAARYASADMMRLLVAGGAVTFVQSGGGGEDGDFAVDWLKYYARATEGNPHVKPEEVPALVELLKVPGESERKQIARKLVLQSEAHYSKGRVLQAYQALKSALYAQPENARALRDLALVALRAGHFGEAAEAATQVAWEDPSPSARADAWFNTGLICEQYGKTYLSYNGSDYCRGSPLQSYLQALKLVPSPARRAKVQQVMLDPSGDWSCDLTSASGATVRYLFVTEPPLDQKGWGDRRQHVYVYHPRTEVIDPNAITWDASRQRGTQFQEDVHPRVVERYDLGELAVTDLDQEVFALGPVTIGTQTCARPKQ